MKDIYLIIPDAVLDEDVDVHLVRRFFSNDAWLVVDVVKLKKASPTLCAEIISTILRSSRQFIVTIVSLGDISSMLV